MDKKPTKLQGLTITSVDLVDQGANPDAFIRFFKRRDVPEGESKPQSSLQKAIAKLLGKFAKGGGKSFDEKLDERIRREVGSQIWDFVYVLNDSLDSIIRDGDLDENSRREKMLSSVDEFVGVMQSAVPIWAAINRVEVGDEGVVAKVDDSSQSGAGAPVSNVSKTNQKEETGEMEFDVSKMTPEETAVFEELKKKYGIPAGEGGSQRGELPAGDSVGGGSGDGDSSAGGGGAPTGDGGVVKGVPELHPEVKKALAAHEESVAKAQAEFAEVKKSLEIEKLTGVAKKYEILGKKSDELAVKLYDLKKAGGTAYDDFVALLDESAVLVEKGGVFGEVGTSRSGDFGELGGKVEEVMKSKDGISHAEAVAKAFEDNPELAAQYEEDYKKGRF